MRFRGVKSVTDAKDPELPSLTDPFSFFLTIQKLCSQKAFQELVRPGFKFKFSQILLKKLQSVSAVQSIA